MKSNNTTLSPVHFLHVSVLAVFLARDEMELAASFSSAVLRSFGGLTIIQVVTVPLVLGILEVTQY